MSMLSIAPAQIPGLEQALRGGTSCVLLVTQTTREMLAFVDSSFEFRRIRYNSKKRDSRFELDFDFKKKPEQNLVRHPSASRPTKKQFPATELGPGDYLLAVYNDFWQVQGILIPASLGACPQAQIEEGGSEHIVTFIWR